MKPLIQFFFFICFVGLFFTQPHNAHADDEAYSDNAVCKSPTKSDEAVEDKYAFIFGVGNYPQRLEWKLYGPPNDLASFKKILLAHGYKETHICSLLDDQVTFENVAKSIKEFLADNVDYNDQVTIYFSGHGAEIVSDDEDYFKDQVLVLYDAGMVDDDFAGLLSLVRDKTRNITLVIDSCHSGSISRSTLGTTKAIKLGDIEEINFIDSAPILAKYGASRVANSSASWSEVAPEGAVVLAAARDGTSAYEYDGYGAFTQALHKVLFQNKALFSEQKAITLRAAENLIGHEFINDQQSPQFHGDPGQYLFSSTMIASKLNMLVTKVEDQSIEIQGLRLPSYDIGAIFRLYPATAQVRDLQDLDKVIGQARVSRITGPTSLVAVPVEEESFSSVLPGSFAVLHSPAPSHLKFHVNYSSLGPMSRTKLRHAVIEKDQEGNIRTDGVWRLVELVDKPAAYSVTQNMVGTFDIIGPEGNVRNRGALPEIGEHLKNHAKQWSIRQLIGEGGNKFIDNETLKIRPLGIDIYGEEFGWASGSRKVKTFCKSDVAKRRTEKFFKDTESHKEEILDVPLCALYRLEVGINPSFFKDDDDQDDIEVGIIMMLYDGSIMHFGHEDIKLDKDRTVHRTSVKNNVMQAFFEPYALPKGPIDQMVLVFGVDQDRDFPWQIFGTDEKSRRNSKGVTSGLAREFQKHFRGNARTATIPNEIEAPKWTVSRAMIKTSFEPHDIIEEQIRSKEYTINDINIEKYLPIDDPNLSRVLQSADALTKASNSTMIGGNDGFPYKQHNWCEGSDEANLAMGIDCSRAIWYVFTRSGLPYTSELNREAPRDVCQPFGHGEHGYLTTKQMAVQGNLTDHFKDCLPDRDFRTGDVLVYRDEERGVGHTVMVIDPDERIAWGSHGWDGSPLIGKTADTGVEYQTILKKSDWGAWDRSTMRLKACWRHKDFSEAPIITTDWVKNLYCKGSDVCDF